MDFKYILTTNKFFKEGPCGRVSHAKGFVDGLVENRKNVTLVSDGGAEFFIDKSEFLKFHNMNYLFYLTFYIEIIKSIIKNEIIVIRWRFFLPYLILPFLIFYKNFYFEVNTITGLESRNIFIKKIVNFSIYIISKFSKIIVVSENSKEEIETIHIPKNKIYVMPNGFNPKPFLQYEPNIDENCKPNLVYFGKKQDYYDWELLYKFYGNSKDYFDKFYIFGFSEENKDDSKIYYGTFNHEFLIKELNLIKNPVLILHSSDSKIAKSGSPMKLFEYASLNLPMLVGDSIKVQASKIQGIIFYTSGDSIDLEIKMDLISKNYKNYYVKSQKLRASVIENYTWGNIVLNWLDTLDV